MNADRQQTEHTLGHNYDGIEEFDNPTPGWWHLIFIATFLFSIAYVVFFHMSPRGWTVHEQHDAVAARMDERAREAQLAAFGSLEPTADNLLRLSLHPGALAAAQELFVARCAACHTPTGAGLVGPNLTDNYAKSIREPQDVFRVVSQGIAGTAMVAWEPQLGRDDTALLAAYVISLRGKDVAGGKAPEGEAMPPWTPSVSMGN